MRPREYIQRLLRDRQGWWWLTQGKHGWLACLWGHQQEVAFLGLSLITKETMRTLLHLGFMFIYLMNFLRKHMSYFSILAAFENTHLNSAGKKEIFIFHLMAIGVWKSVPSLKKWVKGGIW